MENFPVEYRDIFARHSMNIGMNKEFKVKLTPKVTKAVYAQNLPMPIHLKEDFFVELTLRHKYGIITVLPFSKDASPIFAQRKPCAQYVDDIGIAANNATEFTRNIRAVFKCIGQGELKLAIEKCYNGVRQVEIQLEPFHMSEYHLNLTKFKTL